MDVLVIEGGKPLSGSVRISGAKNAVLKLMAASLLTPEECVIRNAPRIKDVENMVNVLQGLGAQVIHDGDVIRIRAGENLAWEAPEDNAREMRASIQIMGPLLARFGRVRIAHPGGCAIGTRPVDLHVNSLRKMGADVRDEFGYLSGSCTQLTGKDIYLDIPSVGATENIMMAATLAKGTTVIRNAAREPEVVEVQNFLNRMGAHVRGAGTDTIRIHGVEHLGGADHTVIPDRIEVGTYMVAAAMTRGELILSPVIPDHLDMVMAKLRQAGVEIDFRDEHLWVRGPRVLRALDIRTGPHPGFPTDMQPQFMAMLCLAHGSSIIVENVYSSRFQHVEELMPMGAEITVDGRLAVVRGPCRLTGTRVSATDLRAGAALVLAGLAAEGITELERVHHVDRGYEDLEAKLRGVGAAITRKSVVSAEALV
ncbi:MAG: UDP-N-acetylglucosamine 1-carboxyvinyltransferase [Limnochordia bacterium]|jgi:UDP-N-acetylglucosamine 1-carboxyvinyltransferase